ncbi:MULTISPECIES: (2Fe-2S)-binding protein [unclassified Sedimentibacter]|uniref:(2Fe-2S)-binding protein n=1 Tax=unclassified Sedimentibacter TaxID=2649220 RepID=UPI0027E0BD73|nr:(2Fe-2S)-binding protein [Sedimentibacter sp. MB35-C1]WMJ77149.1 (2Fe-2S)-binding protein [Sedimentibacter sp. MB35-C1]
MNEEKCCSCCSTESKEPVIGEYVCYCNHVTEQDIIVAIENGALTVKDVIEATGAMKNSNCAVNNPKGVCCYSDIVYVFNKHSDKMKL